MEIVLIRHALPTRTEHEAGQRADPSLTDVGHAQARALARWLSHEHFDRIVASPMARARQTAAPLVDGRRVALEIEPAIAEYDRDSNVYIPIEELKALYPGSWVEHVAGDYADPAALRAFQAEVVEAIERIIGESPGQRVALVCHGGVVNVWTAHVLGVEPRLFFEPAYTSIHRYVAARSGERSIASLNETAHLRGLDEVAR